MNVPKLPNDIWIKIIQMENRRFFRELFEQTYARLVRESKQEHKNKMQATFRYIERPLQMQNYCDDLGYEEYGCYQCYRCVHGVSEDLYYFNDNGDQLDHELYHDLLVNRICSCPNCPCARAYAETGSDDETCFDHFDGMVKGVL